MVTIINAIIVYWVLLAALRLMGRRVPSMMTPFEIIILFLMGGMAIQSILGNDHSLTNALLGISSIVLMHALVATLKQWSPWFGGLVDGTPILIFGKGSWHRDRMHHLRIQEQDIMAAARSQGIERLEQIKYAVVERNGGISIVKQDGVS